MGLWRHRQLRCRQHYKHAMHQIADIFKYKTVLHCRLRQNETASECVTVIVFSDILQVLPTVTLQYLQTIMGGNTAKTDILHALLSAATSHNSA